MITASQPLPFEVDLELIRKLDRNGPRYTSYPTAPQFSAEFGDTFFLAGLVSKFNE